MSKLSKRTLVAKGFQESELRPGVSTFTKKIGRSWYLEYCEGLLEIVKDGLAVPLRCRGRKHLEDLIRVL